MDSLAGSFCRGGASQPAGLDFPRLVIADAPRAWARGLTVGHDEARQSLIVGKHVPGFSPAIISDLRALVRDVAGGRLGPLKFLAFDFVHSGLALSLGADGFSELIDELCNLILSAPVISIACARADLAGADLEFALACSIFVGERGRRFSFAADPTVSLDFYGLLAMKLGFVQAERLMDGAEIVTAEHLHSLMLMKEIGGPDVLNEVIERTARRHNSCYGIYRAQRISVRAVQQNLRA